MRDLAVPVGVAVAIGAAVAHLVPPEWRAAGLSYFIDYGKNVEHAAVTAGLVAGVASLWLLGSKPGRLCAQALAAVGFAVFAWRVDMSVVLADWIPLALAALLAIGLRYGEKAAGDGVAVAASAPGTASPREVDLPTALVVVLLAGLTLVAFVLTARPLSIDVFHHGEVLASAVDLLGGGRPFESFLWPHGFHDTGLAALWIQATGKVGTSPVALAQATCRALGVLTTFALAWRLLASRGAALAASAALVLAVVLEKRSEADAVIHLEQLGILIFVVLALTALLSPKANAEIPAGAFLGLAFVFRLETGVYGTVAALAVLVQRDVMSRSSSPGPAWRSLGASVLRLLLGMAIPLLLLRVFLGWPGLAWFSYTLRELPLYHRDAMGVPFPWPLPETATLTSTAFTGLALGRLLFVQLLLVRAMGGLHRYRRDPATPRCGALLFIAVFGALAMHSALDRSDAYHLGQWNVLPVLGAVLLVVAGLRARRQWPAWRAALVLFVVLNAVDLSGLTLAQPDRQGLERLAGDPGRPWALLLEHVRPNPPVGDCADRFFTPTEARRREGRRFIEATCEVEELLRAHGVKNLVIAHSAPWYYVRFGLRPPTRYFAFARAYTPARQRELVADLRAHRPEALLRVRDFGAFGQIDLPDAVRVPVVEAYLHARRAGVAPRTTPLGDLYLWNEPGVAARAAEAPVGSEVPTVAIAVQHASYQAMSGLLHAEGDCGPEGGPPCGFEYLAQIPPDTAGARLQRGALDLRAVMADGRRARAGLAQSQVRVLGDLSGPEWRDLYRLVTEAAAQGAADQIGGRAP